MPRSASKPPPSVPLEGTTMSDGTMTWRDIAGRYPEFVQWVVQRFGPLPEGEVRREDYERFARAYERETRASEEDER